MDERTYQELKRKIRSEARRKLEALDIVWELLNDTSEKSDEELLSSDFRVADETHGVSTSSLRKSQRYASNGRSTKIRLAQEVRDAVDEISGTFTVPDVAELIGRKYPETEIHRGSVSNALSRMVQKGEGVEIHEEGGGSVPKVYRKATSSPLQDEPPPLEDDPPQEEVTEDYEEDIDDNSFLKDIVGEPHE